MTTQVRRGLTRWAMWLTLGALGAGLSMPHGAQASSGAASQRATAGRQVAYVNGAPYDITVTASHTPNVAALVRVGEAVVGADIPLGTGLGRVVRVTLRQGATPLHHHPVRDLYLPAGVVAVTAIDLPLARLSLLVVKYRAGRRAFLRAEGIGLCKQGWTRVAGSGTSASYVAHGRSLRIDTESARGGQSGTLWLRY